MHCNNLRLVLGLGLVRVSSRVRVRIRVKVRVSVMVRVNIRTSWVVNLALFRCYRPVIYTRPQFTKDFICFNTTVPAVVTYKTRSTTVPTYLSRHIKLRESARTLAYARLVYTVYQAFPQNKSLRSVLSNALRRLSGTHYLLRSLDATRCQCSNLD